MSKINSSKKYTDLQKFVLAHLWQEEMKKYETEEGLRQHPQYYSSPTNKIKINIDQLTKIIPVSLIYESPKVIDVYNQLQQLNADNLLRTEGRFKRENESLFERVLYSITPNGVLFIRKELTPDTSIVADRTKYEAIINKLQVSSQIKVYFKGLRSKLTDKSQDEIADTILLGLKQYGSSAILIGLRLATGMHHPSPT